MKSLYFLLIVGSFCLLFAGCKKKENSALPSALFKKRNWHETKYKWVSLYPEVIDTIESDYVDSVRLQDATHIVFHGSALSSRNANSDTMWFVGDPYKATWLSTLSYIVSKDQVSYSYGMRGSVTGVIDVYSY